jgi:Ferritin-like
MLYIKPQLFASLRAGGTNALTDALQTAIMLEHSTIPPYLYSLYSLDGSTNSSIAEIIHSVVFEEMLHMTLACNVLNAIGGSPTIDSPGFIPTYPGPLPGTVEGELTVRLAPFSLDQIHEVFMVIEEPENPIDYPRHVAALAEPQKPLTIGQYYTEIKEQIARLPTDPNPFQARDQIGPDQMEDAVIVKDAATACQAIDIIVEQGEGTAKAPLEVIGTDYAHYYRFAEVYYGKKLQPTREAPGYAYTGEAIPFDMLGVLPVPTDPRAAKYPAGSAARRICDTFNYSYTNLLKALHTTFNGTPGNLDTAIGLMMSLRQQAKDMMSGLYTDGASVGPSFEYQPVNP